MASTHDESRLTQSWRQVVSVYQIAVNIMLWPLRNTKKYSLGITLLPPFSFLSGTFVALANTLWGFISLPISALVDGFNWLRGSNQEKAPQDDRKPQETKQEAEDNPEKREGHAFKKILFGIPQTNKLGKPVDKISPSSQGVTTLWAKIPSDALRHAGEYIPTSPDMPLKKVAEVAASSKFMNDVYQPILDEAKLALPLLKAVVLGQPENLIALVKENPDYLFKKGQIKAPSGQIYYNVSAYQLMNYLCDDDMLKQVIEHVPDEMRHKNGHQIDLKAKQIEQYEEMTQGGADIIKLDCDPTIDGFDFNQILNHTETYTINNQAHQVTFPLMENPDAILYFKDAKNQSHWYYANKETQEIEEIIPKFNTDDKTAFNKLQQSLGAMENFSARRSNDTEHALIKKTMSKSLARKGIQSELNGERFCNARHDFNRYYNAYREYIRLYDNGQYGAGNKVWCKKLGAAQKEVMWLLQRYCEKGRPFFPLPDFKSTPFKRCLEIYNWLDDKFEDIYEDGSFIKEFGSDFAIYKGVRGGDGMTEWCLRMGLADALDFAAVNRLVEDAKTKVVELKPEPPVSHHSPKMS